MTSKPPALASRIASALPSTVPPLTVHHLSAQPTACAELFSAAPGEAPELTTCEPHFLSISVRHEGALVQVFAVEVIVYATESLVTLFVSKADSTGYLHLVQRDGQRVSPTKAVVTTLLEYLIEQKRRPETRLVVSLFARTQNQYLFPGSIDNPAKHVLDDRALIKWWARILDGTLQSYPAEDDTAPLCAQGHVVVPGCDVYETRAFLPRPSLSAATEGAGAKRWSPTDPLRSLGKPPTVPERCLIPRFPDDPKARFATDLDDEIPDDEAPPAAPSSTQESTQSSHAKRAPGKWRSVRSLAQFWELMAFRQECAAGRLVGFLWGVFEPRTLRGRPFEARAVDDGAKQSNGEPDAQREPQLPTPAASQLPALELEQDSRQPLQTLRSTPQADGLPSPLPSSQPRPPSPEPVAGDDPLRAMEQPPAKDATIDLAATDEAGASSSTSAPEASPLALSALAYSRAMVLLDTLDYADIGKAKDSTRIFLTAVSKEAGSDRAWSGHKIVGVKPATESATSLTTNGTTSGNSQDAAAPVLGTSLLRKKKRALSGAADAESMVGPREKKPEVQDEGPKMLATGLVRKKPKV